MCVHACVCVCVCACLLGVWDETALSAPAAKQSYSFCLLTTSPCLKASNVHLGPTLAHHIVVCSERLRALRPEGKLAAWCMSVLRERIRSGLLVGCPTSGPGPGTALPTQAMCGRMQDMVASGEQLCELAGGCRRFRSCLLQYANYKATSV